MEKVYENTLIIELTKRGLNAKCQVPIEVEYKGEIIGEYFADISVDDQVMLVLKSIEPIRSIGQKEGKSLWMSVLVWVFG